MCSIKVKIMAKNSQNELLALLDDVKDEDIKDKKNKGPKTIMVEEPLKMKGDPLGLIQSKNQVKEAKLPARVKSKSDIVVERYNPAVDKGLTSDDVEQRMLAGLVNVSEKGSTKTV